MKFTGFWEITRAFEYKKETRRKIMEEIFVQKMTPWRLFTVDDEYYIGI